MNLGFLRLRLLRGILENKNKNMKKILLTLSLIIISCSSKEKRIGNVEQLETQAVIMLIEKKGEENSKRTYVEVQDSLRSLLLKSKPNENLKSSILRELYIRGIVEQVNDKITFQIPFNLHGFDCGAPDCYSTDISFEIMSNEPIEFPKNIDFKLFEHGCVDQEKSINSVFSLSEKSTEFVNYFSKELKSNLIIKQNGQLYYYPHKKNNSVNTKTIDKMFENGGFDEAEIVPFQSTIMTSQSKDYEYFIENK